MAAKPSEFRYKAILLGNHGVGKTSLFRRVRDGKFIENKTETTLGGVDVHQVVKKVQNDSITIDLWDTGGAERFRTITDGYYRQAVIAILVFAVDDQSSSLDLTDWMDNAIHYIDTDFDDVTWVVWGNKCDLSFAEVGIKDAKATLSSKCKVERIKFSIVSAKTGKNVDAQFDELATAVHLKAVSSSEQGGHSVESKTVPLDQPSGGKSGCCGKS